MSYIDITYDARMSTNIYIIPNYSHADYIIGRFPSNRRVLTNICIFPYLTFRTDNYTYIVIEFHAFTDLRFDTNVSTIFATQISIYLPCPFLISSGRGLIHVISKSPPKVKSLFMAKKHTVKDFKP